MYSRINKIPDLPKLKPKKLNKDLPKLKSRIRSEKDICPGLNLV